MKITIIKICDVKDKQASYYVQSNKAQGMDILEFKGVYYTYMATPKAYRSPDTEFKSGWSGEWIF